MKRPNYYPDLNKFNLAGPPTWFLEQLYDFDDSLVIVPSRQNFLYRLAQRRPLRLQESLVNDALWKESDTKMLASYSLIPVTTIIATVNWSNPLLFHELESRAPHRMGGAEKVSKMLEASEYQKKLDQQSKTDEHLTYLSQDAWKLYRKKIGLGRSWNITPSAAKSQSPYIGPVPRPKYFTGFSGGF